MPEVCSDWIYHAGAAPDFEGYTGFIRSKDEIDRLADAIVRVGSPPI